MVAMDRRRRRRLGREDDRLTSIGIGELLEYSPLFLDLAIIGEQPQAVLQRVEFELPVYVVAVPIVNQLTPESIARTAFSSHSACCFSFSASMQVLNSSAHTGFRRSPA
jgi:hypothetical protein